MLLPSERYINTQTGFILVEIMVVVAIIGILASIAMPAYQTYSSKARANVCLLEAKNYGNTVFIALSDEDINSLPIAPTLNSCDSITNATGWTVSTWQKIEAVAKSPSNARIECDVPNGTPCVVLP